MADEATSGQDSQESRDAQSASESTAHDAQNANAGSEGTDTGTDTFPRVYVEELRRESAGYRTRAQQAEKELQTEREKAQKKRQEVEAKLTAAEQRLNESIVSTALVVEATRMGFHDPEDAVRLADISNVKLTEAGKAEGVAEALQALATKKPHLLKGRGVSDASASGEASTGRTMNEVIRNAAGRRSL